MFLIKVQGPRQNLENQNLKYQKLENQNMEKQNFERQNLDWQKSRDFCYYHKAAVICPSQTRQQTPYALCPTP